MFGFMPMLYHINNSSLTIDISFNIFLVWLEMGLVVINICLINCVNNILFFIFQNITTCQKNT